MEADIIKAEISGDGIEIVHADGVKEEIEHGWYERKNADGRTVEERAATADDVARLDALARSASVLEIEGVHEEDHDHGDSGSDDNGDDDSGDHDGGYTETVLADGTKIEVKPDGIEVYYADGSQEEVENGWYERKDPAGVTVEERPATNDDNARLAALLDTPTDGGTPDGTGSDGATSPGTTTDTSGEPMPATGAGRGGDDDGPDHDAGDDHSGDDRLRGGEDDDSMDGGAGDDWMRGRGGDDAMSGGEGSDRCHGEGGDDSLDGGLGDDKLNGGAGGDSIDGGSGDDRVRGGRGDDDCSGDDGRDRVRGGAGDDTIDGGAGRDHLWGNAGADTFVIAPGDGVEKIHDFEIGIDVIDLTGFGFDSADTVLAAARSDGEDTLIDLGEGDLLKLDDVLLADLTADDFLLVSL